jgi:hypothetical protein
MLAQSSGYALRFEPSETPNPRQRRSQPTDHDPSNICTAIAASPLATNVSDNEIDSDY